MNRILAFLVLVAGCNGETGAEGGAGRVTLDDVTAAGGSSPLWVAFNDGDGPWQKIDPVGRAYAFTAKTGRYGLAFVCQLPIGLFNGEVIHATAAELPTLTVDCGAPQAMTSHKVSGKFSGVAAGASVQVQGGHHAESFQLQELDPPVTDYEARLPADTYDFAAISYLDNRPTQLLLRRDVALEADLALDLDFAQGLTLADQPLSFTGDGAGAPGLVASVDLYTARARFSWGDRSAQTPTSYPSLPASALRPQELLAVEVSSTDGQPPRFKLRGVIRALRQPMPLALTLPPAFEPQLSLPAGSARPALSFTPYPGVLYYQLLATQFIAGQDTLWLCIFSPAWLDGRTSYQFPDFTGTPGYRPEFGLQAEAVDVQADAVTSSRDFARTINDEVGSRVGAQLTYASQGDHLAGR